VPAPDAAVEVLGVRFEALTREQAARAVVGMVSRGEKGYVVKPYSEFMPVAVEDQRVRDVLNGATLCVPDGIGILWAAHYLSLKGGRMRALVQAPLSLATMALRPESIRHPLPENMSGPDLTLQMLAVLEGAEASVYLLGGTAEEVEGARGRIEELFPRLRIAGARDGYFDEAQNEVVVEAINAASPQVLFVGMGFPRQEMWIAENLPRLNVNVAVAEGGSFTFISGKVQRAPHWFRRFGLEWLFRLARQPWRLKRQARLPRFVRLVVRERLERIAA
jgi:N-acetylglucosaminyldiphosphoundecaprenol N-acetyl-beta-D-mannosaminyltransferase